MIRQFDHLTLSPPVLEVADDEHQADRPALEADGGDRLFRRGALQEDSLASVCSKDASGRGTNGALT